MVRNLRVKQMLMALGGVLAAVLLACGYYAYQLTRQEEPGLLQAANAPDANEVSRKLKLLKDAQTTGKKGFVRLSEIEINSFLNTQFNGMGLTNQTANAVTVRSFVDLSRKEIIWYSVVRKRLFGRNLDFLWERTIALEPHNGKYSFPVKTMRVGDVEVPVKLWPKVDDFFQGADEKYNERLSWVAALPALELSQNELSLQPELRLYNYAPKTGGKQ